MSEIVPPQNTARGVNPPPAISVPPVPAPVLPVLTYAAPGQVPGDWLPTLRLCRIDMGRMAELRTRIRWRIALNVIWAIAVFGVIYGVLWYRSFDAGVGTFLLAMALVMGIYSGFRVWLQERKALRGYVLYLSDYGLMRKIPGMPDLLILRCEVRKILESRWGIAVQARRRLNAIAIPRQTEEFATIRQQLSGWMPIRKTRWVILRLVAAYLLMMAVIGLAYMAISSAQQGVYIGGAVLLTVFLLWSALTVHRSPNIPWSRKVVTWVMVPLIVAAILGSTALRAVFAWRSTHPRPAAAAPAPRPGTSPL